MSDKQKPKSKPSKKKNYYFDNEKVEELLNKYVERGCVDIKLRDEIMSHASELIRQIIRAHNFEYIFPGRDESSFFELFQVAWCQIEKTLYKYNRSPNSPKVFNLWSQIAKTRILAYLKKEKRDKKNMPSYREYLVRRKKSKIRFIEDFEEFLKELKILCQDDNDFLDLISSMEELWLKDEKPYDGLKTKLKEHSGKDIHVVNQFIKMIRLNRDEFSVNTIDDHDFDNKEENGSYYYNDHDE
jgi:hypothetical protein